MGYVRLKLRIGTIAKEKYIAYGRKDLDHRQAQEGRDVEPNILVCAERYARGKQRAIADRRTIFDALREVSKALLAYDHDRVKTEINHRRFTVAVESLRVAKLHDRPGLVSPIEMQNARRHLLSTQLELNAGEIDLRLAAVQLYKALRSWKRTETQFPYDASDSPTPSDFCQPHPL